MYISNRNNLIKIYNNNLLQIIYKQLPLIRVTVILYYIFLKELIFE